MNSEGETKNPRLDALKWFLKKKHESNFDEFEKFNVWDKCTLNCKLISTWVSRFNKNRTNPKSAEKRKRKFLDGKVERGKNLNWFKTSRYSELYT